MNAWDDPSEAARELMCERSELDIAQDHVTLTARYAEVAAERDRLAAGVLLICSDERHGAKVRGLEAQLAAVRTYAEQLCSTGNYWDGNEPAVGDELLEILDRPTEQPNKPEPISPWAILGAWSDQPAPAPTLAAMAKLADAARAELDAERRRLEHAITTSVEGVGLTIVRADPVEQVAAHPRSITLLRSAIEAQQPSHELWAAGITRHSPFAGDYLAPGRYADLPLIPDGTLPPGEVHLRPHPRPADQSTA